VGAVALSTLGILIATLHSAGTVLPPGWSFTLTSGDAALAELIENLLLFIPLGASLVLAGVRLSRAIAIGAALSFSVEFLQQWIRADPSTATSSPTPPAPPSVQHSSCSPHTG